MLRHRTIFVSKMTMLFHERPLMGLRAVLKLARITYVMQKLRLHRYCFPGVQGGIGYFLLRFGCSALIFVLLFSEADVHLF